MVKIALFMTAGQRMVIRACLARGGRRVVMAVLPLLLLLGMFWPAANTVSLGLAAPLPSQVGNGTPSSCTEAALDVALAGGGLVTFNCGPAPHTITLANTKSIILDTTIDGGDLITLSGGGSVRVFTVDANGLLRLSNMTITAGTSSGAAGGGIQNNGLLFTQNVTFTLNSTTSHGGAIGNYGTALISDSTFMSNTAGVNGAGIDTTGVLSVTGSSFISNTAGFRGGGINNYLGTAAIVETRFVNNTAGAYGGGFVNDSGTATILGSSFLNNTTQGVGGGLRANGSTYVADSTFASNHAATDGGAIQNNNTLTLVNSTLSGNTAMSAGGGIENHLGASASVTNVTFVTNSVISAFGGNITNNGSVDIANSIVASGSPLNCMGTLVSNGYNLDTGTDCGLVASGDLQSTNPLLGPFQDNGGPGVLTFAPLVGSPVLDQVPSANCPPTDQRGQTRPLGAACDIGAIEELAPLPVTSAAGRMPWQMLGHDAEHSYQGNAPGPDDPRVLTVTWPYIAGGRMTTSPAIDYTGAAYIGSDDHSLHSVDRFGRPRFTFATGAPVRSSPALISTARGATPGELWVPSPTVTVYFGSDDGRVYSLDSSGTLNWSLQPGTVANSAPIHSSPVVFKAPHSLLSRIYVGSDDGRLFAIFEISPTSATTAWQITTTVPLSTSPALSLNGAIVYVGGTDGKLYCLDALTGAQLPGSPKALMLGALTTPVVDKSGNIYLGSASGGVRSFTSNCQPRPYWHPNVGSAITASPALGTNGDVLVSSDTKVFGISAFGNVLWSRSLPAPVGRFAPVVDNAGRIFIATENGWVYRLTPGGAFLWGLPVAPPAAPYLGPIALDADGRLYLGAANNELDVIDDLPAFQIAVHSDMAAATNVDIYTLRETYGVLDPARTLRLTTAASAERQPAYGLDRSEMAYVSDRTIITDTFLGNALGFDEASLTQPRAGAPFAAGSSEVEPALSPITPTTGLSKLPDGNRYLALATDASSYSRLTFVDLGAYERGTTRVLSLTAWAAAEGVPGAISVLLESANSEQSQPAFSPDGRRLAWRHCDHVTNRGSIRMLTLAGASSSLAVVGAYIPIETGQACHDFEPTFSPDSQWVAMRRGPNLVIYDVNLRTLVATAPGPLGGAPLHPNWSPDGTEIAVGVLTPTNALDVFVLSGSQYKTSQRLTTSGTTDEPYYHYFKMPAPLAQSIAPDRQLPDGVISIFGRGFDILDPQNNHVYFTDTLHSSWVSATVLSADVVPDLGLGRLMVKVPLMAGSGKIMVETRFGISVCCQFYVLPKPASIRQPYSVPGAKVRVFGNGFDLVPASQHTILFQAALGGWVTATASSGMLLTDMQFLIVTVPQGVADAGVIRVETTQGGSACACTFTRLYPSVVVARTSGLPQQAGEGCDGVEINMSGQNYPYDPFFGYGVGPAQFFVTGAARAGGIATITANIPGMMLAQSGLYTASLQVNVTPPSMVSLTGGILQVGASDTALPASHGSGQYRIPIKDLPIVYIAGTSGFSLDTTMPFSLADPGTGIRPIAFPWICKLCPAGYASFPPSVFEYGIPGFDVAGPRVWLGSEFVQYVAADTLSAVFLGHPAYNGGNIYLNALRFDSDGGNTLFPQIVPGTLISTVNLLPYSAVGAMDIQSQLMNYLRTDLGRPINSGPNGVYIFPYDFRQDMSTQVAGLTTFVDSVLAMSGAPKVNLLTHSLGGPIGRAYYLSSPANAAKVDQMISMSGAFGGVGKTAKVLAMGDDWGVGFTPSLGPGNSSPLSLGFAEWEVEKLARNWGTAYFQGPNSENWFLDDVTHGGIFDRRYYIDDRNGAQPVSATYASHLGFVESNYDAAIADRADAFFASLNPALSDFTQGTNGVIHHRLFSHGIDTYSGAHLFSASSARCLSPEPLDPVTRTLECLDVTWREPLYADGDNTVTYYGLLGRTLPSDDRVYVRNGPKHSDIIEIGDTQALVAQLLDGSVCSVQQVNPGLGYQSQTLNPESTKFAVPPASGAAEPALMVGQLSNAPMDVSATPDQWMLRLRGPALLELTDQVGRHLGPSKVITGLFDTQIPNATYNPGLSYSDVSVSEPGVYTFTLGGMAPAAVDIFLTGYNADRQLGTRTFVAVPLMTSSRMTMTLSTIGPSTPVFKLDYLGNGQTQIISPSATLDPFAATDSKAPTTTISISHRVATLSAADNPGGSGVLRTYYLIDMQAMQVYTQPFTLPQGAVTLTAFSIDRNANMEAPFVSQMIQARLFLPIIMR